MNALVAGSFYSRSLNDWGVELQRAGQPGHRRGTFCDRPKTQSRQRAWPRINLQFNHSLQAGETVPVDVAKTAPGSIWPVQFLESLLDAGGPFDEPSFCFANGLVWVRNGFFRQALALFTRVCQLEPDNLERDSGSRNFTISTVCPTRR